MSSCLIGLGSNLQDRAELLRQAVLCLAALPGTRLVAQSSVYPTTPVGGPAGQGEFLNAAVLVETSLAPAAMLTALQDIENRLGRTRLERWGARTIDLDLLLYDDVQLATPELTLPHPRLSFRRFVLAGAIEIAPQMRHPEIGWTLEQLWTHLNTAGDYAALAGGDSNFRRELAQRVALEVPCQAILLPATQGDAIDLIRRAIELLGASSSNSPIISDFWFEELKGQLSDSLAKGRSLYPQVLSPKLLIRLGAAPPFEGPQLSVVGLSLEAAAVEVTAAIQAMRG